MSRDMIREISKELQIEIEKRKRAEQRLVEVRKFNGHLQEKLKRRRKRFTLPRNSIVLEENALDAVEKTLGEFAEFLEDMKYQG